jgi:hypothetical protein
MADLGEVIDIAGLPKSNTGVFDPLPAGWYTATIVSGDIKQTKAGNGSYIAIRYDITGPTHQGRVIFGNLNIRNPNTKAEEIGRGQLGELCAAIGVSGSLRDTDQLIGGVLQIKLDIEKSEQYGDRNNVRAYKPASGGPATAAIGKVATASPAAAKAAPPWAKK